MSSPKADDGDGDAGADEGGVNLRETLASVADTLWGTQQKRNWWRISGAVLVVVLLVTAFAAVAWLGWGGLSALLFGIGFVAGISALPLAILVLRDGLPLGGVIGQGLAIIAQISFGKAALVRREDGQYEWGALRKDTAGHYVQLDRGDRLDVAAEDGDLYSFGLGKLAVVEEHGDNLTPYRETEVSGDSDQPVDYRAGYPVVPPQREDGGILVSLANIQRAVRGSASSTLVRRGRDKALDEQGGTRQLSPLWTMAFATILLLVGFGMTAGVLML